LILLLANLAHIDHDESHMTSGHESAVGRRERKKQLTRAALLRAAMSLFRERGIYGTRVADITTRADVGKGVFYNYFETKDALVAALVHEGLELLEREYLMTLSAEATIESRVEQVAQLHEAFFEEHPDYALLIHQGRGLMQLRGESTQALRDVFRDYLSRLSRWLPPPAQRASWDQNSLLDIAATVAGAVAGYRSFRAAAGLPIHTTTIGEALSIGIPRLMDHRRTS
jgi:AcrR family transcriptional regulator